MTDDAVNTFQTTIEGRVCVLGNHLDQFPHPHTTNCAWLGFLSKLALIHFSLPCVLIVDEELVIGRNEQLTRCKWCGFDGWAEGVVNSGNS